MRSLRTINRPTKALLVLLIPALYLFILNKSLWFIMYLTFNTSIEDFTHSTLVFLLNFFAGIFFLMETVVFLYTDKRRNYEY